MRLVDLCVRRAITLSAVRYAATLTQRLERYRANHIARSKEHGLEGVAVQGYSEQLRAELRALHSANPGSHLLLTSGTTSTPKELWYTEERLDSLQAEFIRQALLLARELPLRSPSIYFLTSLTQSRSLSSALLRSPRLSPVERLALSQSTVFAPRAMTLREEAPELWVQVAYLLLTKPALLVAANPSTVLLVVQQALSQWKTDREIVRRLLSEIWGSFSTLRRYTCGGASTIEKALSLTDLDAVTVRDIFPLLEGVACWTGGYVRPYLTRLEAAFDGYKLRILSLMSLSSEEILGLNVPGTEYDSCVPLASDVTYEFIEDGDESRELLTPWELLSGKRYSMVVSNRYGLKRYDTADLFLCTGMIGDAPLLRFVGRVGLQHSFSGEKLTGEHLLEAYQRAYSQLALPAADTLCFPETGSANELPHYVFLSTSQIAEHQTKLLAHEIDRALQEINVEYRSKRESARLGQPRLYTCQLAQAIEALGDRASAPREINQAQIKLLPLYPAIPWSEMRGRLS